jgi:hypothetical protein
MPTIEQYCPSFFIGFEKATVEFKNLAELMAIPFVSAFSERSPFPKGQPFHRYSVSRYDAGNLVLMAEYNDGFTWYVVGYLSDDIKELPNWKERRRGK